MAKFYPLLTIALVLFGLGAYAQAPTFTVSFPGGKCVPAPVQFDMTSTGVTSLTWTIQVDPSGATVTDQSQTTIQSYGEAGTYSVTLVVTYASGSTASATQQFTLTTAPVINSLTATPLTGCAPLNSCFSANVTGGTPAYTYIWDFCDGDSSTAVSPCHTYTTQGCYCYTLVVHDANGCVADSAVFQSDPNAVCVTAPPTACFTSPNASSCSAPLCVNFVNCSTPGTGLTYAWSFPGGTPSSSTLQTPPCINYTVPGTYGVSLTVTSANGCSNTMNVPNFVNVGTATTCINGMPTTPICEGGSVSPTACGANGYTWTVSPPGPVITGASTQTPTITFPSAGTFTVTLNVTIPGGCSATASSTVTVNAQPTASFTVSGNAVVCQAPQTVNVTNTSTGAVAGATYAWSFPGGSPSSSTSQNPGPITYSGCGSHDISLTVTNPGGCSSTFTIPNAIQINCPTVTVALGTLPPIGQQCAPLTVPFIATAAGTGLVYNWNFAYNASSPSFPQQNLGPTPSWTFPTAGCYSIAVQVINTAAGCTAVSVPITFNLGSLQNAAPLTATVAPSPACAVEQVTLTVTSPPVVPPPAVCCPVLYKVHWGDGGTSQGAGPSFNHQYNDTALIDCFDVTVVRMSCQCHDTLVMEDAVCIKPPIAKLVLTSSCTNTLCITADASGSIGAEEFDWSEFLATIPAGTVVTFSDGPANSNAAGIDSAVAQFCFPTGYTNTQFTFAVWAINYTYNCSMQATMVGNTLTPIAAFTLSPDTICSPGCMNVLNQSQPPTLIAALWKVFDANTGALVATSNKGGYSQTGTTGVACPPFSTPGCYNFQLTVTASSGCTSSVTHGPYCAYGVKPNFTASPKQGCAPLTVNFQDSTIQYGVYGTASSYEWDFGDGTPVSSAQNPSHVYDTSGYFDVTLCVTSITNGLVCENCTTKVQYIHVGDPEVTISALDSSVCAGGTVCFVSNLTGATLPYSYDWNFGDGSPSDTTALPCHLYPSNGVFDVDLQVIDALGCVGSDTMAGVIDVGSIDASFYALDTATSCPPLLTSFINTTPGYDPTPGSGWSATWYFGDTPAGQPPIASTEVQPFHAYTFAGSFDVTLIVTAPNGCTDTLTLNDYIFVGGPTADATASIDTFCPPQQVCFDANPTNSISFLWCFGDNSTCVIGDNTATICHTYDSAGVFESTVLLCDDIGCCYELPIAIIVSDSVHPQLTATATDICNNGSVTVCEDSSFTFTSLASRTWSIDDTPPVSSTDSCVTHTFNTYGTYNVTYTVTSTTGCTGDTTFPIIVTPKPVLTDIANTNALCPSDTVTFNAVVTSISPIAIYNWTFAGGTPATSNDSFPDVVFGTSGVHLVTLEIIAANGCSDTISENITINPGPSVNAGPDQSACANDSVGLEGSGAVTYVWTPGSISGSNPMVLPPITTTYTLVGTDANGCTGTDNAVVFVGTPPTPSVSGPDSICANQSATITASGGVSYEWTDNYGNNLGTANPLNVQPDTTTIYTVIVTAANSCTADTTHLLVAMPLPNALVTADTAFCTGDTVIVSVTAGFAGYAWSSSPAGAIISSTTSTSISAIISQNTTFTVSVTDNFGCSNTVTRTVNAMPLPLANAGPDAGVCINDTIQLGGSGGVTYQWLPGSFNVDSPFVSPTTQQTYTLTVYDSFGCSATDQVVIAVNPLPQPSIVSVDTACSGADLILTAGGGTSYVWSTGASTNPITENPTASTTYFVTVTDNNGCSNDTSKFITVMPLPIANAGNDTAVCYNQPVPLHADSGFAAYNWIPILPLDNSTVFNPTATITDTTLFLVTVTDQYGCESQDSVFVSMLPLPNVQATPMLPYSCGGDPVLVTVVGGLTYVWTEGDQYITAGTLLGYYTATPPNTQTFVVEGTDANGCKNTDTMDIEVMHPFVSSFTADTCICFGDCAQLQALPDTVGFQYTWTPATALDTISIARPTTCTTYDITYRAIVFDGRCYSDTGFVSVCVNPLPTVHAGNDTLILAGSQAYLVASTDSGIGTYEWFPDSLVQCPLCQSTLADPVYITTYFVTLTDDNGCRDEDSVVVDVFCSDASIYIPNAFTPDGDNLNDEYHIRGAGFSLNYFRIYNRWGEKVFETTDLTQGWDGKYKGKLYEPEVFVYYLEAVCSSGEILSKKGNITLIR